MNIIETGVIIDVGRLPEGGANFNGAIDAAELDMLGDEFFKFPRPIKYDYFVQEASNELIIKGKLSVEVSFTCCRCAEAFDQLVKDDDFLTAIEISDNTESVDLTPDIREAILLTFPAYPICKPECKGRCAQCGVDLNKKQCNCKKPTDDRWNDLDQLDVK